ncbi:hypothetical protein [Mycobacterium gastri]|nr:hypothetical protein [Mycobacterium gastri]
MSFRVKLAKLRAARPKDSCYQRDCRSEDSGERGDEINTVPG